MTSHHHSLLSLAASATTFSIILLCCFTLIEALNEGFSVDLIHRDSPDSPFYNASETHSQRVAKALRRSINRVNHFKPSSSVSPNLAQTDIISNSGEYLMKYSDNLFHRWSMMFSLETHIVMKCKKRFCRLWTF
ncbi:aspartic proteinase cdr1 [Quercus suber]|uniref:Aspartic proteinase cdr1 n=1 Tax=Quercus suber TaxID=58331 RepID=A0AAW0KZE9_QUESU